MRSRPYRVEVYRPYGDEEFSVRAHRNFTGTNDDMDRLSPDSVFWADVTAANANDAIAKAIRGDHRPLQLGQREGPRGAHDQARGTRGGGTMARLTVSQARRVAAQLRESGTRATAHGGGIGSNPGWVSLDGWDRCYQLFSTEEAQAELAKSNA